MHLVKLDINHVRNLSEVSLECHPAANIIVGKNAAGKTAILESIYLLARVSSFRTPKITDVIQYGKNNLSVTALIKDKENNQIATGIEKSKQNTQIKFNGNKVVRRSDQARNLPVITITTESHRLLYGTPKERRHWLDWSMFHVEHDYMQNWHDYHYALRQRNSLLRATTAGKTQYEAWEEILAKTAVKLRSARGEYIKKISQSLGMFIEGDIKEPTIKLQSTEETENVIKERLDRQRKNDMVAGHTTYGPHREDVIFEVGGREAGKVLSRGEGKLLVVFLLAIQAEEYKKRTGQTPLILIDDLPSELDVLARRKILQMLGKQKQQLFITSTSADLLDISSMPNAMFHVEHGKLVEVVE